MMLGLLQFTAENSHRRIKMKEFNIDMSSNTVKLRTMSADKSTAISVERKKYKAQQADYLANHKYKDDRNKERGSFLEQWEYFIDNGYTKLKERDDKIKSKHLKGE